jgi:hypothetical protein
MGLSLINGVDACNRVRAGSHNPEDVQACNEYEAGLRQHFGNRALREIARGLDIQFTHPNPALRPPRSWVDWVFGDRAPQQEPPSSFVLANIRNTLIDELLVDALRSGDGIFKEIRESGAYKAALAQTIARLETVTNDLKAELFDLQEVIDQVK